MFCFFRFQKGGHIYKEGGGQIYKNVSKGGHGAGLPPPPGSATG